MNFTSKTDADGINAYYTAKINELEVIVRDKEKNVKRLEAQRNELNSRVRALKEELTFLSEPGSSIGEATKDSFEKLMHPCVRRYLRTENSLKCRVIFWRLHRKH